MNISQLITTLELLGVWCDDDDPASPFGTYLRSDDKSYFINSKNEVNYGTALEAEVEPGAIPLSRVPEERLRSMFRYLTGESDGI